MLTEQKRNGKVENQAKRLSSDYLYRFVKRGGAGSDYLYRFVRNPSSDYLYRFVKRGRNDYLYRFVKRNGDRKSDLDQDYYQR